MPLASSRLCRYTTTFTGVSESAGKPAQDGQLSRNRHGFASFKNQTAAREILIKGLVRLVFLPPWPLSLARTAAHWWCLASLDVPPLATQKLTVLILQRAMQEAKTEG